MYFIIRCKKISNFYKIRVAVFVSSNNPIYVCKSVRKTHNIYFNVEVKTNVHLAGMRE